MSVMTIHCEENGDGGQTGEIDSRTLSGGPVAGTPLLMRDSNDPDLIVDGAIVNVERKPCVESREAQRDIDPEPP